MNLLRHTDFILPQKVMKVYLNNYKMNKSLFKNINGCSEINLCPR
jgi:hypothetical protein